MLREIKENQGKRRKAKKNRGKLRKTKEKKENHGQHGKGKPTRTGPTGTGPTGTRPTEPDRWTGLDPDPDRSDIRGAEASEKKNRWTLLEVFQT